MLRRVLEVIARRLPARTIKGDNDSPYLTKYELLDLGRDRGRLHLHRFHRGDEDPEAHNHPWAWGWSLILAGGYREELMVDGSLVGDPAPDARGMVRREFRPGSTNVVRPDRFHRVELLDGECWTLFASGPIVQSWGFRSVETGEFWPWREFVARKNRSMEGRKSSR